MQEQRNFRLIMASNLVKNNKYQLHNAKNEISDFDKIFYIFIRLFTLPNICFYFTLMDKIMYNLIRKPAVAGRFYPSDKDVLHQEIMALFLNAKNCDTGLCRAIISPHAGYVFSGKVAASAVNQITNTESIKNVFLIGSSHKAHFSGAALYGNGLFQMPSGNVKVNDTIATDLISKNDLFTSNPEAHIHEHSLEVQLPLLQAKINSGFLIVPILLGAVTLAQLELIAQCLSTYFVPENLFVISTDFSHYPGFDDAVKLDNAMANAIITNNIQNVLDTNAHNSSLKINGLVTNCCGLNAVLVLMFITSNMHNLKYKIIDYLNSGHADIGNKSGVVGYYAISVDEIKKVENELLTTEEKAYLLYLAHETIKANLGVCKHPDINTTLLTKVLGLTLGAFVTVYHKNKLRGCIGHFSTEVPLYKTIMDLAISASSTDFRFRPITNNETNELHIEISVLSPLQRIESITEIVIGKHGIYMKKDSKTGTLLPKVAIEQNWTAEQFVSYCSEHKAKIGNDGWKQAELYTYEALVFSDK